MQHNNKCLHRLLHDDISTGFNAPKMLGVDGNKLPSPRTISNIIHRTSVSYYDNYRTMIVFHYGQLVEHDVILTPTFRGKNPQVSSILRTSGKRIQQEQPSVLYEKRFW